MRHVGENIKRIRKEKKMTISDLAGEQISRGMISLIENGKTLPSIERLQYLAEKLNVEVSDLLGNYTKGEMKLIIQQALTLKDNREFHDVYKLLSPLLDQLDDSPEAAQLFELYAEVSGQLEEWAFEKAIDIYKKRGMSEDAMSAQLSLVKKHLTHGSLQAAVEILIELSPVRNSSITIEFFLLKVIAFEALGEVAKALDLLEDVLNLARTSLELSKYYDILKMKALLHYGVSDHESARSIINTANTFVQTVQNERLLADHGILFIHLEEFYEENEEIAVELADEYVKYLLLDSPLPPDLKKEYIEIAYNYKARALVKMGEYSEALELFEQYPVGPNENIIQSPMDVNIRNLSKSYEAICYLKLDNQEKALSLAQMVVEKLKDTPHSPYLKFADGVLKQVESALITKS